MKIAIVVDSELDEHKKEMLEAVERALKKEYEVEVVPFDENFMRRIKGFDLAFNMATGGGKDSRQLHAAAVLDLLGIPYTAAPASAHAICLDKAVTKAVLMKYGISTADFFVVHPGEEVPKDHSLRYPVIVKPVREGSSKGLSKDSVAYDVEGIERAVRRIHEEFGEPALVEEFIEGREVTVGLIEGENGVEVLPILEVDFSGLPEGVERFYSDRVKNQGLDVYIKYIAPARIGEMYEKVESAAKKAFYVLGLRDYARMDFRIKDGQYFVLDVNSLPLLVPVYSDITKMADAAGIGYDELVLRIVRSARRRYGI